jgi:hypothetical protein
MNLAHNVSPDHRTNLPPTAGTGTVIMARVKPSYLGPTNVQNADSVSVSLACSGAQPVVMGAPLC